MKDLKTSTQALLELGRAGDDPTDAAVAQNRRALAARLGVSALGASAVVGTAAKGSAAVSVGTWATAKALLLGGVVVLGAAALVGGSLVWRAAEQRRAAVPPPPSSPLVDPSTAVLALEPPATPSSAEVVAPSEPPPVIAHSAPVSRPASAPSIKEELELVRAAQQALNRGEPRAALALLAEHAQRFPSGVLWEDREASRVFAVCRLGNAAGARALADAFIRKAPKSPFVDRVRAACREPAPPSSR